MRDLNRYVTNKYAADWCNIGIELGLETTTLDIIERNYHQQNETCFQKTLDQWLKLNKDDTTWRTLEVTITNVNRAKLGLDPVDDVYMCGNDGKRRLPVVSLLYFFCYLFGILLPYPYFV